LNVTVSRQELMAGLRLRPAIHQAYPAGADGGRAGVACFEQKGGAVGVLGNGGKDAQFQTVAVMRLCRTEQRGEVERS